MESSISFLIFQLAVLIFSVMIHEISHGYVAEYLGDPTARRAGRLTLNPLKHIDMFGSIILPLILFVTHSPVMLGWAKPVPYDPAYLRNPKTGAGKIALAGPVSNLILAVVFGILLRFLPALGYSADSTLAGFFGYIAFMNVVLAVFNLVPIPPLDGSKVLFAVLPPGETSYKISVFLEHYGMVLLLVFIFFGFQLLIPIIQWLFVVITGF